MLWKCSTAGTCILNIGLKCRRNVSFTPCPLCPWVKSRLVGVPRAGLYTVLTKKAIHAIVGNWMKFIVWEAVQVSTYRTQIMGDTTSSESQLIMRDPRRFWKGTLHDQSLQSLLSLYIPVNTDFKCSICFLFSSPTMRPNRPWNLPDRLLSTFRGLKRSDRQADQSPPS